MLAAFAKVRPRIGAAGSMVRMETGFEIIFGSFAKSLRLVEAMRAEDIDDGSREVEEQISLTGSVQLQPGTTALAALHLESSLTRTLS